MGAYAFVTRMFYCDRDMTVLLVYVCSCKSGMDTEEIYSTADEQLVVSTY